MEKVKLRYYYLNEQELELLKEFYQLAGHIENYEMKNEEIISMTERIKLKIERLCYL